MWLDDPFQRRHADEDGAAPGACVRQGQLVGDAVAVVIGETLAQARDAAEKVKVDYDVLPSVAIQPRRKRDRKFTRSHPRIRFTNGISAMRRQPTQLLRAPSMSPSSTLSTIAWFRTRWSRVLRWPNTIPAPMAHAVEYDAKSACGAARHCRLCRHGAGTQIAGDCARCGRWFRLEDFHLSGRSRLSLGRAQDPAAGEVDR